MKWLVGGHKGRLTGPGIDPRYPKISSDFSAGFGEGNFLHLLQEWTERKMFFKVTFGINNFFSILCVCACLLTKKDWNLLRRAIILAHWRGRNEIFDLISIAYSIFSLLWLHFCEANYEFPCLLLIYCYWNIITQNAVHPGKSFSREWVIDGNKLPSLSIDHRIV